MSIRKKSMPAVLLIVLMAIQAFYREDVHHMRWIFIILIGLFILALIFIKKFRRAHEKKDIIGIIGMSLGVITITFSGNFARPIGSIITFFIITYYMHELDNGDESKQAD